jgi:hypothetical protein
MNNEDIGINEEEAILLDRSKYCSQHKALLAL